VTSPDATFPAETQPNCAPSVPAARDWPGQLALLLAMALAVVPLWTSSLLPMMDLPQHLATVRILHSYGDPAYAVDKYHLLDFSSTQYLSWYFSVHWLSYLMPLEAANRLVLSLYAAGLPLAMWHLLRVLGRDPGMAVLAAPIAYNTFFFMGFANYVTAIPLLVWALAWLVQALQEQRPTWSRIAGLAAVTLVLFYSHAQAFVLYVGLAGLAVLVGAKGLHPRYWWRQSLHLLPSALAMAIWMSRSLILAGAEEWKQGHGGRNVTDTQVRFDPLMDRLTAIPGQFLDGYRGDGDERVALLWLAIVLAAALLGRQEKPWPSNRLHKLPAVWLVALLAVYVLSPISYKWIWPISWRIVPLLGLFALAVPHWQRLPLRSLTLLLPGVALMAWASLWHVQQGRAFALEVGPIRQIVAKAEPGKKLMSLVYGPGSGVLNHAPLIHIGQYYVVDRGGMASFSFANFPQSPVVYPTVGGPPLLPPRFEWTPERFTWQEHGQWYNYVLVRGGPAQPLGRDMDKVELVATEGPYRLYRNKQATTAAVLP
jgi:hypothetical protein